MTRGRRLTADRVSFAPDRTLPCLRQAASPALPIVRLADVTCWSGLDNLIPYRVALCPDCGRWLLVEAPARRRAC